MSTPEPFNPFQDKKPKPEDVEPDDEEEE